VEAVLDHDATIACIAVAKKSRRCMAWVVRGRSGMCVSCGQTVAAGHGQLRSATAGLGSIVVSTTSAMLPGEVDLWMYNTHVTRQCIIT